MDYEINDLPKKKWPQLLNEIPDPPHKLRFVGTLPPAENKLLAIVGSRTMTPYGKEAVEKICSWLKGAPVTIVSGLALGLDGVAHRCALKEGIHTIAIPGSGLSKRVMYPASHSVLAAEIVESGGMLLSEFEDSFRATPWSFPKRNRIVAGISNAILIIEAKEVSGALITARLALDYNRDVGVIPGSIFSPQSQGVNKLLRQGAQAIIEKNDIYELLALKEAPSIQKQNGFSLNMLSPEEKEIMDFLENGSQEVDSIIENSSLKTSEVMAVISSLVLKGLVKESMGVVEIIFNNNSFDNH